MGAHFIYQLVVASVVRAHELGVGRFGRKRGLLAVKRFFDEGGLRR